MRMRRVTTLGLLALAGLLAVPTVAHARYEDGMNLYQYVRSNPARYVDPSGLEIACRDEVMKLITIMETTKVWVTKSKKAGDKVVPLGEKQECCDVPIDKIPRTAEPIIAFLKAEGLVAKGKDIKIFFHRFHRFPRDQKRLFREEHAWADVGEGEMHLAAPAPPPNEDKLPPPRQTLSIAIHEAEGIRLGGLWGDFGTARDIWSRYAEVTRLKKTGVCAAYVRLCLWRIVDRKIYQNEKQCNAIEELNKWLEENLPLECKNPCEEEAMWSNLWLTDVKGEAARLRNQVKRERGR